MNILPIVNSVICFFEFYDCIVLDYVNIRIYHQICKVYGENIIVRAWLRDGTICLMKDDRNYAMQLKVTTISGEWLFGVCKSLYGLMIHNVISAVSWRVSWKFTHCCMNHHNSNLNYQKVCSHWCVGCSQNKNKCLARGFKFLTCYWKEGAVLSHTFGRIWDWGVPCHTWIETTVHIMKEYFWLYSCTKLSNKFCSLLSNIDKLWHAIKNKSTRWIWHPYCAKYFGREL